MPTFPVHTPRSAPAASRPLLEQARERFGFVPNVLGALAASPAALQAYLAIGEALEGSGLTPVEQQVILLTVSFENECGYCMSAHSTVAGVQGAPLELIDALRDGEPLADRRLEALRTFTGEVVAKRGWVHEADIEAFLDGGYTEADVMTILAGVAMKTLSNYANHVVNTPVDSAFRAQAWQSRAHSS
jgi:uncharacterized peroxidase-related enzyme